MIHRGLIPWADAPPRLQIAVELERVPELWLIAHDFRDGERLSLWLAQESTRKRILAALRRELEQLAREVAEEGE